MIVHSIPVLRDNYVYVLECDSKIAVIDPSVSGPVLEFLNQKNFKLDYILNTHHHWDHTDGNLEIKAATGCQIVGHSKDASRIPGIDIEMSDGDLFSALGPEAKVISIDGHTLGHIAYYFESEKKVFVGDTLFSMGCGRLFEGSAQQMWESLSKLASLPPDTQIYCAHEYTMANGKFCQTVEPENKDIQSRIEECQKLRSEGKSTLPVLLETELRTNSFLRAGSLEKFTELRRQKDSF